MAPKPKKGEEEGPVIRQAVFYETEKVLYEQAIIDANKKLVRIKLAVQEYEIRNEELKHAYDKLDEDKADVISYLKKTIHTKNEENNELKDRIQGLENLRDEETQEFKRRVQALETAFITVKAQLNGDNKLLAGKINNIEEFRAMKDNLIKKYERQEQDFEDQEMVYKRMIFDAEKKVVISKDKLKEEMEARLLNLAQQFQDESESRIAASTHRVIRENIALNNQLDNLLFTQAKVTDQNERLRGSQIAARAAMETAEANRDKAINRSVVQLKVIDQLNMAYKNIQKNLVLHQSKIANHEHLQAKVRKLTKEGENMNLQIRILERNLHAASGEQNKYIVNSARLARERDKYKKIIKEITLAIQAALKFDEWATSDRTRKLLDRKVVLQSILSVISRYHAIQSESVESLISFGNIYEKGDLGFVPKPAAGLSKLSVLSVYSAVPAESYHTIVSSSTATPSSEPTIVSFKTVPSVAIIPKLDVVSISSKVSIPSFTVTSIHSTPDTSEPESVDSFEALTDVEKQLALSKLEIQKSILKDLAMSQTGSRLLDKRSSVDMKPRLSSSEMAEGEEHGGEDGPTDSVPADEASENEALAEETPKEDATADEDKEDNE